MKKLSLLTLVALLVTSVAMAQNTVPTPSWGGDILGAHNGYGRGCVMCHAPHGGATGNGASTSDTYNGRTALWGENLTPYYGQTFTFGGGSYPATLPATGATVSISDTNSIVLLCLSCHDGNLATVAMMQNKTVESLPVVGGNALTLFGKTPGNSGTMYYNEHPVGPTATVSCGGSHNWDCTGGGNTLQPINMNGPASSKFLVDNPSSFWNGETITACGGTGEPACTNPTGGTNTWGYNSSGNPLSSPTGGTTVNAVTCTTCHNQHSMTVWNVKGVNYTTMFFIRGFYNPYSGGNNVAQFCRNCHGGETNEMSGLTIPTT
jgi:hypothetical protein